jgi:hypothetical protein
MKNKNPIFIEYYSHEKCDCYKILNPFTRYKRHIIVLCKVSEGLEKARQLAAISLNSEMLSALKEDLDNV